MLPERMGRAGGEGEGNVMRMEGDRAAHTRSDRAKGTKGAEVG